MRTNYDTHTVTIYYNFFTPFTVMTLCCMGIGIFLNTQQPFIARFTFGLMGIISTAFLLPAINKTFFSPALILSPEGLSDCSALMFPEDNHVLIKWADLVSAAITEERETKNTDNNIYLFAKAVTYIRSGKTENRPQQIIINAYNLHDGKKATLAKIHEYQRRYASAGPPTA